MASKQAQGAALGAAKKALGMMFSAGKAAAAAISDGIHKARKGYANKHETGVLTELKARGLSPVELIVEDILVCSRGGGGLLTERMDIVNDLWSANIKANYLCSEAPSFTEQYEYAHDNGIKWLVIITEAALSLAGTVKVRYLDLKVEEDVRKVELVKYLNDISSTPVNVRKRTSSMRTTN